MNVQFFVCLFVCFLQLETIYTEKKHIEKNAFK